MRNGRRLVERLVEPGLRFLPLGEEPVGFLFGVVQDVGQLAHLAVIVVDIGVRQLRRRRCRLGLGLLDLSLQLLDGGKQILRRLLTLPALLGAESARLGLVGPTPCGRAWASPERGGAGARTDALGAGRTG